MTGSLLDTSVVSRYLRPRPGRDEALVERVRHILASEGLTVSVVTVDELRRGIELLLRRGGGTRKAVALDLLLGAATVLGLEGATVSRDGRAPSRSTWMAGPTTRPWCSPMPTC